MMVVPATVRSRAIVGAGAVRRRRVARPRLACVLALLVVAAAAATEASSAAAQAPVADDAPLALAAASLRQLGPELRLEVRARRRWTVGGLVPGSGRSLCLELRALGDRSRWRICPAARGGGRIRLTLARLDAAGGVVSPRRLTARVARPNGFVLRASIAVASLPWRRGALAWSVRSSWTAPGCPSAAAPCRDAAPYDSRAARIVLRVPRPTGCRLRGPSVLLHASRRRRAVALTFDDGPAAATPAVMRVLRRLKARATFFMLGSQVRPRAGLLRRMLAEGHEIANHSWSHPLVPSASQLSRTNRAIRRATGFTPCSFRAPYGALSGGLVASARALGMRTVGWDVDTNDWRRPGARAIVRTVMRDARRGSVVLMHDGGGPRGGSLAAVEPIVRGLRRRGLRLVTVSELFGGGFSYAPR